MRARSKWSTFPAIEGKASFQEASISFLKWQTPKRHRRHIMVTLCNNSWNWRWVSIRLQEREYRYVSGTNGTVLPDNGYVCGCRNSSAPEWVSRYGRRNTMPSRIIVSSFTRWGLRFWDHQYWYCMAKEDGLTNKYLGHSSEAIVRGPGGHAYVKWKYLLYYGLLVW